MQQSAIANSFKSKVATDMTGGMAINTREAGDLANTLRPFNTGQEL